MNPFDKESVKIFEDSPEHRVILVCQNCDKDVFKGMYFPKTHILLWECPHCSHRSSQKIDLSDQVE